MEGQYIPFYMSDIRNTSKQRETVDPCHEKSK